MLPTNLSCSVPRLATIPSCLSSCSLLVTVIRGLVYNIATSSRWPARREHNPVGVVSENSLSPLPPLLLQHQHATYCGTGRWERNVSKADTFFIARYYPARCMRCPNSNSDRDNRCRHLNSGQVIFASVRSREFLGARKSQTLMPSSGTPSNEHIHPFYTVDYTVQYT